jgi:hypothetical protein
VLALCSAACGGDAPPPDAALPAAVEVLAISPEPAVSIGVVEGDEVYQLHNAVASIQLADGRVVVANAGSAELRFFDAAGRYLRSAGGRGGGPGEFRWLTGLYPYGADSLLAVDGAGNRISVFDTSGTFARLTPAESVSGDSMFPADTWLYRRFWVRGAWTPALRRAARGVLDAVPLPGPAPWYRFAQLDAAGHVWFREPPDPANPDALWTVAGPGGRPVAVARLPLSFEPHVFGAGWVLGRWRDENDVNFIRRYELRTTGDSLAPPPWFGGAEAEPAMPGGQRAFAEALDALKQSLTRVVMAQETYYADHGRYSPWADSLTWELPEGTVLDILAADARGWIGVAAAVGLPHICAMAVGAATPPGWPEGSARCSGAAEPGR